MPGFRVIFSVTHDSGNIEHGLQWSEAQRKREKERERVSGREGERERSRDATLTFVSILPGVVAGSLATCSNLPPLSLPSTFAATCGDSRSDSSVSHRPADICRTH